MKENSIEEDIEILEEFKTHGYAMLLMKYEDRNKTNLKIDQAIEHILSDYKRVLKENEELKEYIATAPNLDEMTATKYINIQQDAYIQSRAEEQQKAEQIIYENYIPKQKIKDKIEKLNSESYAKELEDIMIGGNYTITELVQYVLQELLEKENKIK